MGSESGSKLKLNTMTAKLFLTTLVCGASLCLVYPSHGQEAPPPGPPPGEHPGPGPGGPPAGERSEHHAPGEVLKHLTRELNLTEDQQNKIRPILEESAPLFQMIKEDAAAKVKAVLNGVTAQVRPILNPDQQKKLEGIRARMEEMRGTHMMGGRFSGAGPMRGRMPLEGIIRELNLTPDQMTKVKAITETIGPKMKALHEDSSVKPEDRRTKMRAIIDEVEAQVRPILTPDQAKKLDEMKAKRPQGDQRPPEPPQP